VRRRGIFSKGEINLNNKQEREEMEKLIRQTSQTHYYVQMQQENDFPKPVPHTIDEEKDEMYYRFIDRKKAQALADATKKANPDNKYRVVKSTETFYVTEWF